MRRLQRHHNALFASDLDGTLIPVENDPSYPSAVRDFRHRLARQDRLLTAWVTGRAPQDTLNVMEENGLPLPHVLCCDVGTRIEWAVGDRWIRDEHYDKTVRAALGGVTAHDVFAAFADATAFVPQDDAHQSEVKMSFRLDESPTAEAELEASRIVLLERDWKLSLVASRSVYDGAVLLDVLPGGVDKAAAVHHVRRTASLTADDVVYAGDSGNDLAPLTAGFRAVIVANAAPGLADRIAAFAADEGRPNKVHAAARPHLHGVLEGARRFGIF